jgi:hypothetical protein
VAARQSIAHMLQRVLMGERRSLEIEEAGSPVSGRPSRAPWGAGRIALFARLDSITSDLAAGWPMTAIYKRHMAGLGISYSGFCKLVRRHASEARPEYREPAPSSDTSSAEPNRYEAPAPVTTVPATPVTPQDRPPSHAADEQPRGTFRYSPIAREGEIDRLFGSGFFAGKK